MKKIIIISYYSKPSNFVGAERINGWLNHLSKKDVYPVLVTRFWENNQYNISNSTIYKKTTIEKFETYEIHRIASKESFRELLIRKNKFRLLRKILSFIQILYDNLLFTKSQYYPFFKYTDKFLREHSDYDTVIISGTPFHSFSVGYNLKTKHRNINWYPDYRDQWTTHPFKSKSNLIEKFIFWIESRNELKWTSNCSSFLTVSENWRDIIYEFIKKPGYVVKNGFDIETLSIQEQKVPKHKNKLVISYIGTIYPYQNYKLLLEVVGELVLEKKLNIEINFIGIDAFYKISPEIKEKTSKFSKSVNIIDRIPKNELKAIYKRSDLLWLTSLGEMQGWYPVKLFEYASQGIPTLLFPTDNDVMEDFIKKTSTGFVFYKKEQIKNWIISIFNDESSLNIKINKANLEKFTRRFQTEELVKIIERDKQSRKSS